MAISFVDEMEDLPIDLKNLKGLHLIPVKEQKIIKSDTEIEYSTVVCLLYDSQLIQSAMLQPGDIYEYSIILHKFGEKNLSKIGKKSFKIIIEEYESLIPHIKTVEFYSITGWINNEKFLLNNFIIYKDNVKKVDVLDKTFSKTFDISVLNQFDESFVNIIIKIFNDRVLSEIFLIYKFFSLIVSRLPQNANSFSTLLAVIGITGSRKTSTVNAFFNPLEILNLQSSFEDTKASVEETFRNCNDTVLIVDDMSKNNNKQAEILEKILRLVGDKTTGGKKMRGNKILNNKNKALAVVTGELLPELPISSLARLLVIELDEKSVNLENLTILQKNPEKIIRLEINFIQWIQNNPKVLDTLTENFENLRTEFLKTKKTWHPRCIGTLAWLIAGAEMVNKFFKNNIVNISNFKEKLFMILQEQWANYGSGEPFYNYISTFLGMIESGEFKISKDLNSAYSIKKSGNLIIFANEPVFKKVITKILECENNGNISNKKLLKELSQVKVLIKVNGKNTYSENFSDGISRRCVKLNYLLLKKIIYGDEI